MNMEVLESIVRIMDEEYVHDARFEKELLKLLDPGAGSKMTALCKYTIDCLADNKNKNVTIMSQSVVIK